MAKSKHYEVGYAKPPKAGQWKKGQSGNPSGKKKAGNEAPPKPFFECFADQLSEMVEVTANGKKIQMTYRDALIKRLKNDLMVASLKDKIKAFEVLKKLGVFDVQIILEGEEPEYDCFTEEDRRIIAIITSGLGD
jgi:hypothetical protein